MIFFDFQPRTRVIFGPGSFSRIAELARELKMSQPLIVADPGIVEAGYANHCPGTLFSDFGANPDSDMVECGRKVAEQVKADGFIGLGGGSSMDCAKAINFVFTNGGHIRNYWGHGKATKPMLPMIGVPTTAGTGSEAQSYAIISDADSHVKMACGDPKAAFAVAILDPDLTRTQPPFIRATAGYDAISHAVESFVSTKANALSKGFAKQAWELLSNSFSKSTDEARADMQLGAHLAGMAIENSMLGATHACANPLTANYGTPHGVAIAVMLRHVVEWNAHGSYHELHPHLASHLEELAHGLPRSLRELNVPESDLPKLAEEASAQWTGKFNPRPFDAAAALTLYRCAY